MTSCDCCGGQPGAGGRLLTVELGTGETVTVCWECRTEEFLSCRDCGRLNWATDMYGCLCERCVADHRVGCRCEGCEWEYGEAGMPG